MNSLCKTECPTCGGTGLVRHELELQHPEFGKLCPCPEIPKRKLPDFDKTGLDQMDYDLGWNKVFKLGDTSLGIDAVKEVLERGYGCVFLYGSHGLAKTLILKVATSVMFRRAGSGVAYRNMTGVLDDLRSQYDNDRGQQAFAERMRYWQEIPFLALDELDKCGSKDFAIEKRFELLDGRYNLAVYKKGITLIAANAKIETFGPYLADRFRDGRNIIVELGGPSARPSMSYLDDL